MDPNAKDMRLETMKRKNMGRIGRSRTLVPTTREFLVTFTFLTFGIVFVGGVKRLMSPFDDTNFALPTDPKC